MARKTYTGINQFKKYRDNSRKAEAFRKKIHRKAISNLKKISRQKESERKKRMNAYKREADKAKSARAKSASAKTASEPFTFDDFKYLLILSAFIFLAVTTNFIVAIIVAAIVFVVKSVIELKRKKKQHPHTSTSLSQAEIDELQRHLSNIEVYKDVANNSSDACAVQCAMDELLKSIDFIMTYAEEDLHVAGLSKEKLPAQRAFIIQHYDDMIEQAKERSAKSTEEKTRTDNIDDLSCEIPLTQQSAGKENMPTAIVEGEIPPLEARLRTATPSKQGLYPHEILMLSYAHTYKISQNTFQEFWNSLYSVTRPQSVLVSLNERDFLAVGNLRATIEHLKVSELKEELQAIGAKTTGKKAELIDRLMEVGDTQALEERYPDRYYALTKKGQQELDENEYVVYLHRMKYMSIWDMNYLLHHDNPSHLRYRDILWREFNIQSGEHFKAGNFGLYRNTRMYMYQFLMEEEKYTTAFSMLCEVIAYDLSGLGNNERLDHDPVIEKFMLEQNLKLGFPYSTSMYKMPPAIIEWISDLQNTLKLSDTELRANLLKNFKKISIYRRIFTNEECVEVVMNEIGNHPRKQAALYKQAEERLKEKLGVTE